LKINFRNNNIIILFDQGVKIERNTHCFVKLYNKMSFFIFLCIDIDRE